MADFEGGCKSPLTRSEVDSRNLEYLRLHAAIDGRGLIGRFHNKFDD